MSTLEVCKKSADEAHGNEASGKVRSTGNNGRACSSTQHKFHLLFSWYQAVLLWLEVVLNHSMYNFSQLRINCCLIKSAMTNVQLYKKHNTTHRTEHSCTFIYEIQQSSSYVHKMSLLHYIFWQLSCNYCMWHCNIATLHVSEAGFCFWSVCVCMCVYLHSKLKTIKQELT